MNELTLQVPTNRMVIEAVARISWAQLADLLICFSNPMRSFEFAPCIQQLLRNWRLYTPIAKYAFVPFTGTAQNARISPRCCGKAILCLDSYPKSSEGVGGGVEAEGVQRDENRDTWTRKKKMKRKQWPRRWTATQVGRWGIAMLCFSRTISMTLLTKKFSRLQILGNL